MNRMRLWRAKKMSKEAGRLTQICVWAPERDAELARRICTRVAEPTERGESLRALLVPQLERRRTVCYEWRGRSAHVEMDLPLVGRWSLLKNIGGRIIGPEATHIELSPEEANDLKHRLNDCCQREIEAWLKEHKLLDQVRDNTGVITGSFAPEDPNRPADETAFALNEARIATSMMEAVSRSRKPPVDDPSIVQYEGFHGFPSFCQVAHRKHGDRVQFALIHMKNGGTNPTNMFESLATYMRQRFYPKVDAGKIDWFDVVPLDVHFSRQLSINGVKMQQANGVYHGPEWFRPADDPAWFAVINETVARGRAPAAPSPEKSALSSKRRS